MLFFRKFNSILKHAKNIVVAFSLEGNSLDSEILRRNFNSESLDKIQSDSSLFYFVRRNQYARGQVVLYLFSENEACLIFNYFQMDFHLIFNENEIKAGRILTFFPTKTVQV